MLLKLLLIPSELERHAKNWINIMFITTGFERNQHDLERSVTACCQTDQNSVSVTLWPSVLLHEMNEGKGH